jgi:hypothetical protein
MSSLTIDLTEQQHQTLKDRAARQRKTVKEYALEKLFEPAPDEDQAWADLKSLIEERISQSRAGAISAKTFDGIVEEELRAGDAA